MGERLTMNTEELSEATGLSISTIRRERREGRLRASKIRGRWVYPKPSIDAWLAGGTDRAEGV